MSNYLSPFKERTFTGRYKAALQFQIQNFPSLLIIYILLIAPLYYFIVKSDNNSYAPPLAGITGLLIILSYYAIFLRYIKSKKIVTINGSFFKELARCTIRHYIISTLIGLIFSIATIAFAISFSAAEEIIPENIIIYSILVILFLATIYLYIPSTHFTLTSGIPFNGIIKQGIILQNRYFLSTFGYMLFCIIISFIVEFLFLVALSICFLAKYGEDYEPDNTFVHIILITMVFTASTFIVAPMLYHYGYILTKETKRERMNNTQGSTPTISASAEESNNANSVVPVGPTADDIRPKEEKKASVTYPPEETHKKNRLILEGNGVYSLSLRSTNGNDEQLKEFFCNTFGFTEEASEEILTNLPSTFAERLSMSEALNLRSIIEQEGGSVDIK